MFSKFTEFIKLLPDAYQNKEKILNGLINEVKSLYGKLPEDEQAEILRRRIICRECPFYSLNAKNDDTEYQKLLGEPFIDKKGGKYCSICGCSENLKTSSLDSNCGLEAYNMKHPDNKQQLKWEAYKK